MTAEKIRLEQDVKREQNWKRWGPYLSERQWGTVREDYSPDGSCWTYFPHDLARSRAYRWGEDGLLGITDRQCRLCFALALWNENDSILKERLFGLTGPEGNHGEDVKENYYYLDSTPTHSYMRALYKYPQQAFPYTELLEENKKRGRKEKEYELNDTGIFKDNKYFDVEIEYAKHSANDILIAISITNNSADAAPIHILPTLWFRNTWSWGRTGEGYTTKPEIKIIDKFNLATTHPSLDSFKLSAATSDLLQLSARPLMTENETNVITLFQLATEDKLFKDGFHNYIVNKDTHAASTTAKGTKGAFHYHGILESKKTAKIYLRLVAEKETPPAAFGREFLNILAKRKSECKEFFEEVIPQSASSQEKLVMRQSYAGLLWSKQFYYYAIKEWREGDPSQPAPDPDRATVRNRDWNHLYNRDIISMPDKWEYPWYAAWDLAFHTIPLSKIDPVFAKQQLVLLLREWYMHPNGQIPAYEFAFSDVNPPVHAWACWRIYKITAPKGERDRHFLSRTYMKLLVNFTWWINRKDTEGHNLFAGGFLGLDNIGVFDRSQPLPFGSKLLQADATAWMAFYSTTMLSISLELAVENRAYGDIASKFFEHFISITDAMNHFGGTGLWDEEDGFYYDQVELDGKPLPIKVRSLVGIIPLLAVEVLDDSLIAKTPGFKKRMNWFIKERKDLAKHISYMMEGSDGASGRRLLAVPSKERLHRMLKYILDENEFLSPFGIRSLSKIYQSQPYRLKVGEQEYTIDYEPGESTTSMFGGNSNWRGPIWFPLNYLIIEALEKYHYFYQDSFKVECPVGSGVMMNLKEVSQELAKRLAKLFLPDAKGVRPCHGDNLHSSHDPAWKDLVLFYEYFDGDTGLGCGASHQTGWTSLVSRCIERYSS